jgi:hypothetical protein
VAAHPYRSNTEIADDVEPIAAYGWGEDLFIVALIVAVGALGIGIGLAADSPVEVSIGLVLVIFAGKVFTDIVCARRLTCRRHVSTR